MQRKKYIRPAVEIVEIDIEEMLNENPALKVSGQTSNFADDWDSKEFDSSFDDDSDTSIWN